MKPQIKSVIITIAPDWGRCIVTYESGRTITKHICGKPEEYMLYPMEFLRITRSITHIVDQLAICGCIPTSIKNWMHQEHPKAAWRGCKRDERIFTFRLDKERREYLNLESAGICLPKYEEFSY